MAHEKFVIPKHLSIFQALQLLYSIVATQCGNIFEDFDKISQSSEHKILERIYKQLEVQLNYLDSGFRTIEKKFGITDGWNQWVLENVQCKELFEEFRILENDIRIRRRKIVDILTQYDKTHDNKKLIFWKTKNKIHIKDIDKREDQIIMKQVEHIKEMRRQEQLKKKNEEERLRKQKELERKKIEDKREKILESRIKEQVEQKMNRKLKEQKIRQKRLELENEKRINELRNEITKSKQENGKTDAKIVSGSSSHLNNNSTRRSLDIKNRSHVTEPQNNGNSYISIRKSLESPSGGNSSDRRSLDMNRAAVIAWTASQKSNHSDYSNQTHNYIYRTLQRNQSDEKDMIPKKADNKKSIILSYGSPVVKSISSFNSLPTNMKKKTRKVNNSKPTDPSHSISPKYISKRTMNDSINSSELESSFESRLQHIMETLHGADVDACQQIVNDIMVSNSSICWDDVVGLEKAKNSLKEAVVYPFLRPDLFKGLREPIRGMLLFGPPGTGKTMIAKAVATESKSTFFSISASSLLSKYLGESEKLVRALFYLAKRLAPSIIFIDEIDSLLGDRSENSSESSRRIKTELLIQWSELSSSTARDNNDNKNQELDNKKNSNNKCNTFHEDICLDNRVLVLAATNLPWIIDEAARRRFSRRLYIPLPDYETRLNHLKKLMNYQKNSLSMEDFEVIATMTDGYSSSDITSLAKEAAMEPIRDLGDDLMKINFENVRPVSLQDFRQAMHTARKSISKESLKQYEEWATLYGSDGS
ncbi:hypothetical protein RI543_002877 [Arxiozyma heterogenica]|uniref:AAA+ ATPase domain-containing protein n=1 Tax=Arxiozyma heterogenica TaxID=278026 RepID=A0AAN7WLN1_9SACH|nr:hypothetical protein RI543_002877 [Kazachstania heterogenica]